MEERFAGIAEISSDAVITIDAAQTITFFNLGAQEIFGYAPDEVLGRPLEILLPHRFRGTHSAHVREFGQSPVDSRRMGERRSISGLRRSGQEFPAEASIAKLDVGGERVYAVVLRDITDRQRTEEAQRFLARAGETLASSLEYGETLASIADMAVERLADWCVVYGVLDDGSIRPLRVAHHDAARQPLLERLLQHTFTPPSPHPVLTAVETGRTQLVEEFTRGYIEAIAQNDAHAAVLRELGPRSAVFAPLVTTQRRFGAIALFSSSRVYDAHDLQLGEELTRRASIAIENARLYREAQQAIGMREEVLRIVSHELGNPLSAIFVGLKVLRRQLETNRVDEAEQPIRMIHDSASQLRRLIDDLLEVQRIEAGRLAMAVDVVAVPALLDRAVAAMAPLTGEKGLTLEQEARGAPASVRADADRLLQVFGNLIGNAIKFTPPGGVVRVTAEPREGGVVFAVSDSGPGIAPDDLPHVFDRFWRARNAGGIGSGLGLAIARGIVEAHRGEIWVESELGRGATFFFRLDALPDR